MLKEERCDLCGSDGLESVYTPPDSRRGMIVFLCLRCGLLQSLKRGEVGSSDLKTRSMQASSGADWGNIRYGKGFRTAPALKLLRKYLDLSTLSTCLDIGSNRGSFIKALRELNGDVLVTAVEPDSRVTGDYASMDGVITLHSCLEETDLKPGSFDFAYSCHTIEHVDSPTESLDFTWRALKPGGILYMEAPRTDLITAPNFLEEYFIDKHCFHFTEKTLLKYLHNAGFEILNREESGDGENIAFVLAKREKWNRLPDEDPVEVSLGASLIVKYKTNLTENRAAMRCVGAFINSLASKGAGEGPGGGIAVWGAGRLFDSLVKYGALDKGTVNLLIDCFLVKYMDETNGYRILHPNAVADSPDGGNIDTVIIMSRAFEAEIRREIEEKLPGVSKIYAFSTLLESAKQE